MSQELCGVSAPYVCGVWQCSKLCSLCTWETDVFSVIYGINAAFVFFLLLLLLSLFSCLIVLLHVNM